MFCLFVGEKRGEDMTNKQKLMFGSLVGIVALLGIILLLFIRQSQGQPHTSPAPQIDTNKVVKRINGELFTDAGFGTYLADPDNYAGSTYMLMGRILGAKISTMLWRKA